jgi:hypothetical protein
VIILFWIGFAIVVGVGANTRGRNGPGWGLLAVLISPLLAGLLLLALPRLDPTVKRVSNWERWKEQRLSLTTDNKSFYVGVSVWVVLLLIVGVGIILK